MKYSLRSLFVVVTLITVLLGGRVEYLRRWAEFHRREAKSIIPTLFEMTEDETPGKTSRVLKKGRDEAELVRVAATFAYHQKMQEAYTAAIYRPWTLVNDDRPRDNPRAKDDPFR
jgi:hypothetical protein